MSIEKDSWILKWSKANIHDFQHTDGDTRLIMKWVKGPQPKKSSDTVTKVVKSLWAQKKYLVLKVAVARWPGGQLPPPAGLKNGAPK